MAIAVTRFSHWLLGGPDQNRKTRTKSKSKTKSTDFSSGFHDSEPIKLNFSHPTRPRDRDQERTRKSRRHHDHDKKNIIDKEHDMVIVPSDGSGSESDSSDWSIGWLEPHPHDFCNNSDAESADSFAVLVPCYGHGRAQDPLLLAGHGTNVGFGFGVRIPIREGFSESNEFLQQWLSSLPSELPM
ncbi:hypothetical protein LUZ62_030618 [Rhynchospora pubera]|uniref:Uncharacterized protein n=1 Tax=Rhynchospora pubera TaxID=906938 RepID=A0AAV8HPQ0_9POAL|nr:hypothetical protein LUZ62_045458 [Rhynchospora pubera]KAJ4818052.1 hypothetical protein LUZ62_030618 [Rhynchospora pubera]